MPTWLVYLGLLTAFISLLNVIRPSARLRLGTRRRAGIVVAGGVVLILIGTMWPVGVHKISTPATQLDLALPVYHFHEVHHKVIDAPGEAVLAAFRDLRVSEIRLLRTLFNLRSLSARLTGHQTPDFADEMPILQQMGVVNLPSDSPHELVFGMVMEAAGGADIVVDSAEAFAAFDRPGCVRVAFNIEARPRDDGRILAVTETRIQATDEAAARLFARYWRVILPGSALLRLTMLDAVAERTKTTQEGA
ncbi:MAG: hypothetical protein ABIF77_01680 [bacterium]